MHLITVIVLISCALCSAQKSSQDAAILSDSRYLATNGKFGSSYTQEDGVEFKEEADVDGNRRGSYSYVDPLGHRRTVTYTAGVDGFRPSGDFLPVPIPPPITVQNVQQTQQDVVSSGYQINPSSLRVIPNLVHQVQYQSLPGKSVQSQYLPNSLASLKSLPPIVVSSTEYPSKFYPPGKLNVQQSQDGFSYTFNTIV